MFICRSLVRAQVEEPEISCSEQALRSLDLGAFSLAGLQGGDDA